MHSPWKMWVGSTLVLLTSLSLLISFANRQVALALATETLGAIETQNKRALEAVAYAPDTPTIIGGEEAAPGAWPWMVALVYADNNNAEQGQFCGGSLINAEWILTAAHCTFEVGGRARDATEIDVVIGRHALAARDGSRLPVQQIIRHPGYTNASFDNDLALLQLRTPVEYPPIAVLAPQQRLLESHGRAATVIGWGVTALGIASSKLQQAAVPLVDLRTCRQSYGIFTNKISDNMICAGSQSGGIDSCQGDSGGPLMVFDETLVQWLQVGIVSWGDGCAEPNYYGVYTRVSSYTAWLHAQIPALALPTATAVASSTPTATATFSPTLQLITLSPTPTTTPTPIINGPTPTSTLIPTTMPTPTSTLILTVPPLPSNNRPTVTPTALAALEPISRPTVLPAQALTYLYLPLIAKGNFFGVHSGSFEANGSSSWQEFSLQGRTLVHQSATIGIEARTGSRLVMLGGIRREVAYVYQKVNIPTTAPILEYWVLIRSADDCGYDFGGIVLDDRVIDKFDLCQTTTTTTWQPRWIDLSRYVGTTVMLEVRAETDRFLDSTLFVDDVNLVTFAATVSAAAIDAPVIAQPLDQPVLRQTEDERLWHTPER